VTWLERFRPPAVPEAIARMFGRDEHLLALAPLTAGGTAVVTRYGLYLLADGADLAERVPWHLVSKARLDAGTLSLTVADEVGVLPGGAVLLRDRVPVDVRPQRRNKLTDVVHSRVRGSVVASQRLAMEGATGWLALRSVAGQDGLVTQFRPDAESSAHAAGLDDAVTAAAQRLTLASGRRPVDD
jgi:hypothetical protein